MRAVLNNVSSPLVWRVFHFLFPYEKLNFNLVTECLLARSKTLKMQDFVEKFWKSIYKAVFDI